MAYNQLLHESIARILADVPGFTFRKMFGGVGYMIHGNMACGVTNDELFLRLSPESIRVLETVKGFHETMFMGPVMKGWLNVDLENISSDDELREYLMHGVRFAESLTPK